MTIVPVGVFPGVGWSVNCGSGAGSGGSLSNSAPYPALAAASVTRGLIYCKFLLYSAPSGVFKTTWSLKVCSLSLFFPGLLHLPLRWVYPWRDILCQRSILLAVSLQNLDP